MKKAGLLSLLVGSFVVGSTAPPAFAVPRYAFVTSSVGNGDLSTWSETDLDGYEGADQVCQARANAGGLSNGGSYRAWISTQATDAYCHLLGLTGEKASGCSGPGDATSIGPWLRMDDTPYAGTLAEMTEEFAVYQPVMFDETGTAINDLEFWHWTGTNQFGMEHGSTCVDWTLSSDSTFGGAGVAWEVGRGATYQSSNTCNLVAFHRLLCLEAGEGDPLKLPAESGALAFVTSVNGTGDLSSWEDTNLDGLAGADEICRDRARAGDLPNPESFVAWLSDGTTHAKDRITVDGPFVRVDGFRFAASKSNLTDGDQRFETGLNVTEFGTYLATLLHEASPWTGTGSAGTATDDHCLVWSSAAADQKGTAGNSESIRPVWTVNGAGFCLQSHPLYCFSNVEMLLWDNFERGNTSRWSNGTP